MRIPAILLASLAFTASAQAPQPTPVVQLFPPTGPLPSYEVATIKKAEPGGAQPGMIMPIGGGPRNGQTIKTYILNAYGVSSLSQSQIVGGPAWLGTEAYVIQGKVPDELRAAMQTMKSKEQGDQNRMMQQSLLADRFKLKVHFEIRELPVYDLAAVKGGLKIKEVPAPPPFVPGGPPPAPPARGEPMRPGMIMMSSNGGSSTINARAVTMSSLISLIRSNPEIGGKPIVDKTGFPGNFDVVNLRWAGLSATGTDTEAPSLFTALEETLGLKLTPTKGPVEVVVIDSIERPSEN